METSNANENLVRLLKEVPADYWAYALMDNKWEVFTYQKLRLSVYGTLGRAIENKALVRRINSKGAYVTLLEGPQAIEVFEFLCKQRLAVEKGKKFLAEEESRKEVREMAAKLIEELEKNK